MYLGTTHPCVEQQRENTIERHEGGWLLFHKSRPWLGRLLFCPDEENTAEIRAKCDPSRCFKSGSVQTYEIIASMSCDHYYTFIVASCVPTYLTANTMEKIRRCHVIMWHWLGGSRIADIGSNIRTSAELEMGMWRWIMARAQALLGGGGKRAGLGTRLEPRTLTSRPQQGRSCRTNLTCFDLELCLTGHLVTI